MHPAKWIAFLGLLLLGTVLQAQQNDTLSFYRPGSGYVFFHNPEITVQAARFVNPAPGYLKEISVALGGTSVDGTARLRVFGHEGGVPAPILEHDLIDPILLKKSRSGFEKITVSLSSPLLLENNQFFIAVDRIDSGVVLLSDQVEKTPFCSSGNDVFYYQLLKQRDGGWRWDKYSYVIDAVMEYSSVEPATPMGDIAASVGIIDTVEYNRSVAWGDVNKDGYLDLLWDGRLYFNKEGEGFERVGKESGIVGSPLANLFLDANNDGHLDLLFIGSHNSNETECRLFFGQSGLTFTHIDLPLLAFRNPTSFSVSDVDGDGFLDVFVGQAGDTGLVRNRLLLNDKGKGFLDASERLIHSSPDSVALSYGSQFTDIDRDGDPDLYIANRYPGYSMVLYNDGSGNFIQESSGQDFVEFGSGTGGDWKDFDNDGDRDLLYPRLIHPFLRKAHNAEGSTIYSASGEREEKFSQVVGINGNEPIEYEERHAGGTWGDVNNDGLLDAFFTTFGDCRFAELYVQNQDNTFAPQTFDYGLHWSSAGEDGIWVDYDNDGWLDLCVIEWNRLRMYKNPGDGGHNNFIEIDPVGKDGSADVGASVTVYSGNLHITREVTVGRGILMGDPSRLHYGLATARSVDSILVRWSNDTTEVFTDITINSVNRLERGRSGIMSLRRDAAISAVPNPFSDQLHIYYSIPTSQHIRIEIYNHAGALVTVLLDQEVSAGDHSIVWNAVDGSGDNVSGGVYLYRLVYSGGEISGRAVLTR